MSPRQLVNRLLEDDEQDFLRHKADVPTPPAEVGSMNTVMVKGRPAVYRATACFIYGKPGMTFDLKTYDGVPAHEMFGQIVGELYGVNDTHALYKVRAYRHGQTDAYWGVLDRATGQKTRSTLRPSGMRVDRVKMELDSLP